VLIDLPALLGALDETPLGAAGQDPDLKPGKVPRGRDC
jgi:hypothetical protein